MGDQINGLLSPYLRERRFEAAEPYLEQGRVLDVGCGIGRLAEYVGPERYLGFDLDHDSVEQARREHPQHRFLTLEEFERYDPSERFDLIVALAVIEHVPDPTTWLVQMRDRLAPGGRVLVTTPHASLEWAHSLGARVGLFSRSGAEEHNVLFNRSLARRVAAEAGMKVERYSRFLMGANQLIILRADS